MAIEADQEMLEIARKRLIEKYSQARLKLVKGNFKDIGKIAEKEGFSKVKAVIFDLGVSNLQLTSFERGFSFSNPEAELDMRIDMQTQNLKASDLLNILRKDQLEKLFSDVLHKKDAGKIVKEVVSYREDKKIEKVGDFLTICKVVVGKKGLNKVTLPFLALRMAVNSEIENLSEALAKAFDLLETGGRLLVITFHSGEDKVVKEYFRSLENKSLAKIFKEIIRPKNDEIIRNPRSRSAKLRIIEKK